MADNDKPDYPLRAPLVDPKVNQKMHEAIMKVLRPIVRASQYPEYAIHEHLQPVLDTVLGVQGGELMADTLAPIITSLMAIPEVPEGALGRLPELPEELPPTRPETPVARKPTEFLGEAEPRFHGTRKPIPVVKPGTAASASENLYGPGFYTTDNYTVAGGYAGVAGPRYRVYEINPVKFLNPHDPIPKDILQRLAERTGDPMWLRPARIMGKSSPMTFDDFMQEGRYWMKSQGRATKQLMDELEKEGYGGVRHVGGKLTGGEAHDVKIYWHPERDIRIRPHGESYGWKVAPPEIGKAAE